ncbi:MAG: hypothetical protein ABI873_17960 [Marmoricola sp.]
MRDDDRWGDHGLSSSGDPGHSEEFFAHGHDRVYANDDAARMGLDRNTLEGAQLAFFSQLSPSKRSHKAVAWMALFLLVGLPLLLSISHWVSG